MDFPNFKNLAPNLNTLTIGNVRLFFSYSTLVAFSVNSKRVVHENIWTKTTGKHLNMIDGGDIRYRYNSQQFKDLWDKEVGSLFVNSLFN